MGKSSSNSSTVNTYDAESSRKLAAIAERQQDMAEDAWSTYKQYFQDYEISLAEANKDLLPYITSASKATMDEQVRDLELNRPVKDALREQQLKELEESAPISTAFYKEAAQGVDKKQWMDAASSDVAQAFANQAGEVRRNIGRMGGNADDPAVVSALAGESTNKAKAVGAARTGARQAAENENFNRLATAMGVRGSATGLAGVQSTQGNGTQQFSTPDMAGRAMAGMSGAASSYGALASRVMGSSSKSSSSEMDLGSAIGMGAVLMCSRRFKENIVHLSKTMPEDLLQRVARLEPASFFYKPELAVFGYETGRRMYGLIAEEVYKVLPEMVALDQEGAPLGLYDDCRDMMLLMAVQELAARVARLEKEMG